MASSSDDLSDKKGAHTHVQQVDRANVDIGAELTAGSEGTLDPQEALRIRRKIDWHILPLMCLLYLMQYADKSTLGQSAVLGLLEGANLTQNQFNWLGTIFYLSYLVFEYPQNLALQRFPVGKWMSANIFVWSIVLMCHAACTSFGGLFAVRFIMGICEGAITAGFLIVTSMFYTREEQTVRVGYWFLMNGTAIIALGIIAFGVLHTHNANFMPWQWLVIIFGLITFITSILFWFFFPDSPANARFLTPEERRSAVIRIKGNQAGVENKHFKWDQFWEALKDPKTWLFFLMAGFCQVPNSLSNQRQLIVNEFGYTLDQTTLLGMVDGAVEIVAIWSGVTFIKHIPNSRSLVPPLWTIPGILGAILIITLDFSNKIGLIFSYWISIFFFVCTPVVFGWVNTLTAGHTKRVTTNAIVLIGYAIGNASGPFMWKEQYKPRNRVPWIIIIVCEFVFSSLMLLTRAYLANENKKRDLEQLVEKNVSEEIYVLGVDGDGEEAQKVVDKAFLDLTDMQNRDFRYVL